MSGRFPYRTKKTLGQVVSAAKYSNQDEIDLSSMLNNMEPENLRDICSQIEAFYAMSAVNGGRTGTEEAVKGFLGSPLVMFSKDLVSHVDGNSDPVFEGLKDTSKENHYKQLSTYMNGVYFIRVMLRDIVEAKFNGSWSAFFSVIVNKSTHGYEYNGDLSSDIKEIDENYIYRIINDRDNWLKEPAISMIANILACVAMALKEVRSERR